MLLKEEEMRAQLYTGIYKFELEMWDNDGILIKSERKQFQVDIPPNTRQAEKEGHRFVRWL